VKTYWYLTRASGAVALILLSLTIVIGIAAVGRTQSRRWPRFAVDAQHRSTSLLAFSFLIVHIATAVLDSYAPISLPDAIIPFVGAYRPLWLGLGATAFDLLLAVAVTSLVRDRLGHRTWRAVHWLVYAAWPVAVVHGLGTGSDVRQGWMTLVYLACGAAVAVAILVRIVVGWPGDMAWRLGGVGVLAGFALALAVWLPSGPLAPGWARRAGTPARLLPAPAPPRRRRS
jgi:predicted ferric reductase